MRDKVGARDLGEDKMREKKLRLVRTFEEDMHECPSVEV